MSRRPRQHPRRPGKPEIAPRTFRLEREGAVATLTLDRPQALNALTFETYRELHDTFVALQDADDVGALIITGAGAGFCSGGDVKQIVAALGGFSPSQLLAFTRLTGRTVLAMRRLRKPIVAAINGAAVGAGAVIALAADLRVVSERARFGFVFPRLALSGADMGASWLLPRIVGFARASELLLTGAIIDAATADRYGLCTRLVPHQRLLEVAGGFARELAASSAFAQATTKEMLNREAHMDLESAIEAEARAQQICMMTEAFRDRAAAAGAQAPGNPKRPRRPGKGGPTAS